MCFDCGWENVAKHIVSMKEQEEKFGFADDFLSSVLEQIKQRHHISPKQKNGIRNVWKAGNRPKEKQWDRRYEGHERGNR